MFLSRVRIDNFRNFHHLDVLLGSTSVIVGENGAGKSNLLFALRLILDPRLWDSSRRLREEDFWGGLNDPVKNGEVIDISVEFQDFKNDSNVFAVLQPYCVQGPVEDTARLTYRYRPKPSVPKNGDIAIEDYEFVVFGGTEEKNRVDHDVRRWIPVEVLPALRDSEGDLDAWRQSPLRPLLERLNLPDVTLKAAADGIDQATVQLLSEPEVQKLTDDIQTRLSKMVGTVAQIDPTLGFAPTIPERLTRALRLFGDGASQRPVGELSLGVDNLLYLLLLTIELERKEETSERATTIVAIEEPEAHLHPHLQRLVFRDYLRRGSPVLLTTHSPHIASVAPLTSIVLLRDDPAGDGSRGTSTLEAGLAGQEIADLERYLDATKAEVLFARGVILVEGLAELFLIPALAENLSMALDQYGITVCSVLGTDFVPYAKLLGPKGLDIPFVIVTDGDPFRTRSGREEKGGLRRVVALTKALDNSKAASFKQMYDSGQWNELSQAATEMGIFVGNHTLEVDLFNSGHGQEVVEALRELGLGTRVSGELQGFATLDRDLNKDEAQRLLEVIERRVGKGRVAQRLAERVDAERFPHYTTTAIVKIVEDLSI